MKRNHMIEKKFHDIHDVPSCPFCGVEPHGVTFMEQTKIPNIFRSRFRFLFKHEPKMTRLMRGVHVKCEIHGKVMCPQCGFFVTSSFLIGFIRDFMCESDIEDIHKKEMDDAVKQWNERIQTWRK